MYQLDTGMNENGRRGIRQSVKQKERPVREREKWDYEERDRKEKGKEKMVALTLWDRRHETIDDR